MESPLSGSLAVAFKVIEAGAVKRVLAVGLVRLTAGARLAPVHGVPLSEKLVGFGLLPLYEALKPGLTVPPEGRLPFQAALRIVALAPDWVKSPFQLCWICWLPGQVQVRFQLVSGSPRLLMTMLPVKPVGHWLGTV